LKSQIKTQFYSTYIGVYLTGMFLTPFFNTASIGSYNVILSLIHGIPWKSISCEAPQTQFASQSLSW